MEWDQLTAEAQKYHVPTLWLFRERFQTAVLYGLAEQGAFSYLVFQGGTALRLCYQNPRFSEDLDFVMRQPNSRLDSNVATLELLNQHLQNVFPWAVGRYENENSKVYTNFFACDSFRTVA